MFNEQLRDVLTKGHHTLAKIFEGANSGKLNQAQQLACLQYVAYLNDSIMQVFTNPQVTSAERPKGPDMLSAEMGFDAPEQTSQTSISEDSRRIAEYKAQGKGDEGTKIEGKRRKK